MHDQKQNHKELWGINTGSDSHIGMKSGYWERFLCARHEADLGEPDRYAIQFCRDFYSRGNRAFNGFAWRVDDVDQNLLALFAYSCIWRTAVAGGSSSGLGPYESKLRAIIFDKSAERFDLILERVNNYDSNMRETHISVLPHRRKVDDRTCWCFTLAGFRWWVRLDARPFTESLAAVAAAKNPMFVINRDPKFLGDDPDLKAFARPLGPRVKKLW